MPYITYILYISHQLEALVLGGTGHRLKFHCKWEDDVAGENSHMYEQIPKTHADGLKKRKLVLSDGS